MQALSHRLTLVVSGHTLAEQQTVRALRAHVHEEILKHKNRYALNVSVNVTFKASFTRNESESDQHDSGKTLGSIVSYCNSPVSCTLATV